MSKIKGYYGKVVEQGADYVVFESGSRHFTLSCPEGVVGKFVMVDSHGRWWVKQ